jgi:HK97 family phage major capsid protein
MPPWRAGRCRARSGPAGLQQTDKGRPHSETHATPEGTVMPVLQIGGNQVFSSEANAASRLATLRAYDRNLLSSLEAEELDALEAWAEHEGVEPSQTRTRSDSGYGDRLRTEARRADLHRLAQRAGAPGAGEQVDGRRVGYGSVPFDEPPAERGGWVTMPGADPGMIAYRNRAMACLERFRASDVLSAAAADRADRALRGTDPLGAMARYIAAVSDPSYLTAFGRMLADPQMGHLRYGPEEVAAVREAGYAHDAIRALGTGSTGVPLPFTLDPSILITSGGALNPIRDLANVSVIATHDWQGVSSTGVVAGYVAEGTEALDGTPTLAGPRLSTQQGRAFVPFSIELSQDWTGIQNELVGLVNDARGTTDAQMFLTGSGTAQPMGILGGDVTYSLGTADRVLTAGTATFAVGDAWLLKASIPPRFIATSTFAAAPATWDTQWQFVAAGSTSQARQFDAGRGGDFMGRPKVEWSTMDTATTTGKRLIIAGDFRAAYKIVDRLGMSVELIPHLFGAGNRFPTGQRGLYCYWRTGAGVVAHNALRYLETR